MESEKCRGIEMYKPRTRPRQPLMKSPRFMMQKTVWMADESSQNEEGAVVLIQGQERNAEVETIAAIMELAKT